MIPPFLRGRSRGGIAHGDEVVRIEAGERRRVNRETLCALARRGAEPETQMRIGDHASSDCIFGSVRVEDARGLDLDAVVRW
jgi:hypothetical protein